MVQIVDVAKIHVASARLVGVQLEDDSLGVMFKSLCQALDLSYGSQLNRLRRQPMLSDGLQLAVIQTHGGPQHVNVLLDWAIPIWLAGLQINRLAAVKQQLALLLQRQIIKYLYAAFRRNVTPEPSAAASAPAGNDALAAQVADIDARLSKLTGHVDTLEQSIAALRALPTRLVAAERLVSASVARLVLALSNLPMTARRRPGGDAI